MRVPVWCFFFDSLSFDVALPRANDCTCSAPSRQMVAVSSSESALTTELPTPWRPPE